MQQVFSTTLLVTIFVIQMMVLIEALHERARRHLDRIFRVGGFRKYLLAATIGATPGCLGPLTVSAMYSHGLIPFGSIIAGMVAASGDEAFVLLALLPGRAWWIFGGLLALGVVSGIATDGVVRLLHLEPERPCHTLDMPCDKDEVPHSGHVHPSGRTWSMDRLSITALFCLPILLFGSGIVEVDEGAWLRWGLTIVAALTAWVVAVSDDHFVLKHLRIHILKHHAPRILLWTLGAILFLHFAAGFVNLKSLSTWGEWPVLLAACLIGIIPESGPHVIFVTLYAQGAIPLSVLMANFVVQDGHGMLPLLAESRRAFVQIKIVKLFLGLLIGGLMLAFGR